jgi:hypothetical protein
VITNNDLPNIAEYRIPYGEAEEVKPGGVVGVQPMPEEWREKLRGHVFGEPQCYVVDDVRLAGPNLAGFKNNDLILSVGYYGRLDLWERNKPYFQIANECLKLKPIEIECAFSMAGVWSGTYFHWLIDHLPTLQAYYKYARMTGETPLVLLSGKNPGFVTESLDMLGIEYFIDERCSYRVKRLVVPTWPREEGFMRPSAARFVRDLFRNIKGKNKRRKIYISRRNAKTRRVEHEEVLEELLLSNGFTTEVMEGKTFQDQRRLMAETSCVVGPHGAGLANIVTREKPTTVEFVTPAYTNPCCWLVSAAMGAPYGYVVGEAVGTEDMRLDMGVVREVMEAVGCLR